MAHRWFFILLYFILFICYFVDAGAELMIGNKDKGNDLVYVICKHEKKKKKINGN